ncbi:MAG: ribosome biogenesis GTPase YlqF [Ruminococcaceae bacterium]|nr:ribosome biogenesis GTPase YlqF [Oscillospiraceae bacterium]
MQEEKQIQWFPGHMAKTRRLISENLKNVDITIEILDARIPKSSRNPEIVRLTEGKPSLILLNKCSLADPEQTKKWVKYYTSDRSVCIATDCVTGEGMNRIAPTVKDILSEKVERYENKGMIGRSLKAMVLGIPNVGKSSLINKISGSKKTKVENRPGVTLDKQWVATNVGLMLLDMPGVLWPKFDDRAIGENLAATGAIKDAILDLESLSAALCGRLRESYPALLAARYKLKEIPDGNNFDLLCHIGRKRGFLISGGEIDTERTANMLLEEFRSGKIGRITLDTL